MVYNYETLMNHNLNFYNSLVDLKVVGWKTYTSALGTYTYGFFNKQLKNSDSQIEALGEKMKQSAASMKEHKS